MTVIIIVILLFIFLIIIGSSKKKSSGVLHQSPAEIQEQLTVDLSFEDSKTNEGCFLVFDVETDGLPKSKYAYPEEVNNWPRVLQISWLLFDKSGDIIDFDNSYLKYKGHVPAKATEKNNITDEILLEKGQDHEIVWNKFIDAVKNSQVLVAHNIDFDVPIVEAELIRNKSGKHLSGKKAFCTMKTGTNYCRIPSPYGNGYKYPTLEELFQELFYAGSTNFKLSGLHDAQTDVAVTAKCFFRMVELNLFNVAFLREEQAV